MSKKKKLIPELRFPEFKNEGEWEEKTLRNLGQFLGGGTPERSNSNYWIGNIPWISSSDINEDNIHNISITRFINDNAIKQSATKRIPKGSVLFVSRVGVGKLAINKEELCTSQDFTSFVPKKDVLNFFIGYYFSSNKNLLRSLNQGTSIKGFSKSDLENLKLPYPKNAKEQQKISACLSFLDEAIAAHSQKLELLKDHKKGLMQNLFPQEGEKVPKYRFKEFVNDGEWVQKRLIDTTDKKVRWSFTGGPFGSNLKASDYTANGIRIIQLQNIGDGEFNDDYKIYTSEEKADELLGCNIYSGEMILSKMGDPVGRACIIPDFLKRCVMASDGIRLVVDEKKYSKYFIYSLINSNQIREAIEKKATGSTRKRIGLDELKEIELIMPKTLAEQQKIASCLSALDGLITAQAEKIEQLKQQKKGLMQRLFPKMND